jgi:hypothetical protein
VWCVENVEGRERNRVGAFLAYIVGDEKSTGSGTRPGKEGKAEKGWVHGVIREVRMDMCGTVDRRDESFL